MTLEQWSELYGVAVQRRGFGCRIAIRDIPKGEAEAQLRRLDDYVTDSVGTAVSGTEEYLRPRLGISFEDRTTIAQYFLIGLMAEVADRENMDRPSEAQNYDDDDRARLDAAIAEGIALSDVVRAWAEWAAPRNTR